MSRQDQMMIDAQARHITNYRHQIDQLEKKIVQLKADKKALKRGNDYYMLIQEACLKDENIMNEFQRFMMTCNLSLEEPMPGITEKEYRSQPDLFYRDTDDC